MQSCHSSILLELPLLLSHSLSQQTGLGKQIRREQAISTSEQRIQEPDFYSAFKILIFNCKETLVLETLSRSGLEGTQSLYIFRSNYSRLVSIVFLIYWSVLFIDDCEIMSCWPFKSDYLDSNQLHDIWYMHLQVKTHPNS